jgi:hypothetical protein
MRHRRAARAVRRGAGGEGVSGPTGGGTGRLTRTLGAAPTARQPLAKKFAKADFGRSAVDACGLGKSWQSIAARIAALLASATIHLPMLGSAAKEST